MVMAAQLGAVIRDPEFVQFHPTAIDIGRDPAPLATEALRGDGAVLIDRNGHRFMPDVHEHAELAPRDVVARAVHAQNLSGAGAYLDAREAVGAQFPDHFPAVFKACMSGGIDPRTNPIPVAPAAHYHMGGVETDLDGFTGVPGLWAVGECASTGVHGANRLASNSLLEGLVFGHRAAQAIHRAPTRQVQAQAADAPCELPQSVLQTLRSAVSAQAGVTRSAEGLTTLLSLLDALEAEHGSAPALIAARFLTQGALVREESRGGHCRTDFPQRAEPGRHTRLTLSDLYPAHAKLRKPEPPEMIPALPRHLIHALITRALEEDLGGRGDVTSLATIPADKNANFVIKSRANGVLAGQQPPTPVLIRSIAISPSPGASVMAIFLKRAI